MTKRQLIDEIVAMNRSAEPAFLAQFDDADLSEYLRQLRRTREPRLLGDARRYEKYFSLDATIQAPPLVPGQPLFAVSAEDADEDDGITPAERAALKEDALSAGDASEGHDAPPLAAAARGEAHTWIS